MWAAQDQLRSLKSSGTQAFFSSSLCHPQVTAGRLKVTLIFFLHFSHCKTRPVPPLLESGQDMCPLWIMGYGRSDTLPVSRPMPRGTVSFYFLLLETFALRARSCQVMDPTVLLGRGSGLALWLHGEGEGPSSLIQVAEMRGSCHGPCRPWWILMRYLTMFCGTEKSCLYRIRLSIYIVVF